jgi:hypothetical protein
MLKPEREGIRGAEGSVQWTRVYEDTGVYVNSLRDFFKLKS